MLQPRPFDRASTSPCDSGSTDFVLPPQAYKALKRALAAQCETHRFVGVCKGKKPLSGAKTIFDGYCYPMTDEERARWPPIQLTFEGGVTLEIPTSVYDLRRHHSPPQPPGAR